MHIYQVYKIFTYILYLNKGTNVNLCINLQYISYKRCNMSITKMIISICRFLMITSYH